MVRVFKPLVRGQVLDKSHSHSHSLLLLLASMASFLTLLTCDVSVWSNPTTNTQSAPFTSCSFTILCLRRHKRGDVGRLILLFLFLFFYILCQNGLTVEHFHMRCRNVPVSFLHFQEILVFISCILKSQHGAQ